MAIHSDTFYRRLAEDQVKEAGIIEPPVALARIAESLGVPVQQASLPPFFQAALINKDGLPTILLNMSIGERERRAAFGHVIGHMLDLLSESDTGYPRDQGEHRVADILSLSLVMPDNLVMDQARKWFNDHRYLAGLFGVTEEEMLEKMVELGLIAQRGLRWDY